MPKKRFSAEQIVVKADVTRSESDVRSHAASRYFRLF
jgi:hypothetical protein